MSQNTNSPIWMIYSIIMDYLYYYFNETAGERRVKYRINLYPRAIPRNAKRNAKRKGKKKKNFTRFNKKKLINILRFGARFSGNHKWISFIGNTYIYIYIFPHGRFIHLVQFCLPLWNSLLLLLLLNFLCSKRLKPGFHYRRKHKRKHKRNHKT